MRNYLTPILLILSLFSCAGPNGRFKVAPIHSMEIKDPELKVLVNEFMDITARKNIKFKRKVSIGFADIKDGSTIGTCTYGGTFREIDIDEKFWKESNWINRTSLVFHELAHCYCGRDHDFDSGKMYPDSSFKYIFQNLYDTVSPLKLEGYMEDGCPKSVMHPKLMDEYCFRIHYNEYIDEMLNRCEPY